MVRQINLRSAIAPVAAGVLLFASLSYGQDVYPATIRVAVTYFDYHSDGSNPDFNSGTNPATVLPGMVKPALDNNGLPVGTTTYLYSWGIGKWFRPWRQSLLGQGSDFLRPSYNAPPLGGRTLLGVNTVTYDTSYKNVVIPDSLTFTYVPGSDGVYQFQSGAFFPLDGRGFGADVPTINYDGNPLNRATNTHNYSFAMHLKRSFQYRQGLYFNFEGDDDLWVFVNGQLVLDLGGVHGTTPGNFSLDQMAAGLGLNPGDSATIDVFYCERQAVGSDILITSNIITGQPAKLVLSMVPKVDTLPAGSIAVFSGSVVDNFNKPRPEFNQYIQWALSPGGTTSRISPVAGPVDTFYAVQAFKTYIITATFNDPTQKPIPPVSDTVYVSAGPPDHLVIEADANGLTRSPWHDDPVGGNGSVTIGSASLSDTVYATLRDKFGNYAGQSQNTKWDTITIVTPNVVRAASGTAALGQGIISKIGVQDSEYVKATALNGTGQLLLNAAGKSMMDTIKAYVSNITYDALRIVSLSPGDTVVLSSLVMTTDQDTLLTVQGLRTAILDWVNVPGNWSLSANLKSDTAAPSGKVTWLFSPTDTGTGSITVTFAGKTVSIPVTVKPGAPRSLVLYPQPGVPSAANKAYPRDTTVVAGVNFPLVAKMFDDNNVWLSSYETAASNALISWQLSDSTLGTLTPLTGYQATFNSTKAHHSVVIVATFKQGTAIYADTIGLTIVPGPVTQLVIEANNDINLSPNAAMPVDSITINANETFKYVYAILRDAYGNWVSYSQQTVWNSFDNTVANATNGIQLQGQGTITRVAKVGTTQVSAANTETQYLSLHLADTIKVIVSNIFYRALRIVVQDSTDIISLTMNTNQDTTLKVLGLRSDNGLWEPVVTHWGMTQGLITAPMPPGQAGQWSFSPVAPGTGWVRVYMDNDSTRPDTALVTFTPGPPTNIDISVITPANQLIAGDTIRALVRIQNKDGLVPGLWCDSTAYQDTLGNGGRLPPIVIGDGGSSPLTQKGTIPGAIHECFQNGIDTIKFVLFYAPYNSDSAHQIFVSLGSLNAKTEPFKLLPGDLYSLRLESATGIHLTGTDSMTYPNGHVTIYSVGYDMFGNKRGRELANWSVTQTLHPLQQNSNISGIYYDASNATYDESGLVIARAARFVNGVFADSMASDSLGIFIKGPPSSLDSAVTRDANGNGYLDEIELYFNKSVTILPSTSFTITAGGITFTVDSVGGVAGAGASGETGTHFVVYLHEQQNGSPQTAWRPLVSITGMQGTPDINKKMANDGAGPVIWTVTKTIVNPEDRKQDVITVTFSEPITGPGGGQFAWSTVKPSDVLTVYKLNAAGTGYDTLYNALDSITSFAQVVNDSTVKFTMTNGNDITSSDYINIKSSAGQIFDTRGNAPVIDNRKAPVKLIGALPPRIIAVPNPSGPTFFHEQPGVLNFQNNPNARTWVRTERAGTVITFQLSRLTSADERVEGNIVIYDAVGNLVMSAHNDYALTYDPSKAQDSSAYIYDIYWNGSNGQGLKVAPGVYRTVVYLTYTSAAKSEKKRLWGTVGITY